MIEGVLGGFWLLELGLGFGFVGGVGLTSSTNMLGLSVRCSPEIGARVLLFEGKTPASVGCSIKDRTQQKPAMTTARDAIIIDG